MDKWHLLLDRTKATTAPYGRDEAHSGKPIKISELLATIDGGAKFVERVTVTTPAHVRKAKKRP